MEVKRYAQVGTGRKAWMYYEAVAGTHREATDGLPVNTGSRIHR